MIIISKQLKIKRIPREQPLSLQRQSGTSITVRTMIVMIKSNNKSLCINIPVIPFKV